MINEKKERKPMKKALRVRDLFKVEETKECYKFYPSNKFLTYFTMVQFLNFEIILIPKIIETSNQSSTKEGEDHT